MSISHSSPKEIKQSSSEPASCPSGSDPRHFSGEISKDLWLGSCSPWTFQVALVVKNPPANAEDIRDVGLIPGLGRSPGGGQGNPLQYFCLENPMDRRAWWATVHSVAQSWTRMR